MTNLSNGESRSRPILLLFLAKNAQKILNSNGDTAWDDRTWQTASFASNIVTVKATEVSSEGNSD